jgi:nicotinamide-nucleotide amidase
MRIEIICTGDEVLTGKIVNTNFSYMTQKLEDVGLAVAVGDHGRRRPREPLLAFQLAASAPTRSSSTAASGPRSTTSRRRSPRRLRASSSC